MPRPEHHSGLKWFFETARFEVQLHIDRLHNFKYDGDDETGETQAALDSGEFVAFDSTVTVLLDGVEIGRDHLGSSVYARDEVAQFWTDHRGNDAMNRNCSIMRKARGGNVCICHYFPSMVSVAIQEARHTIQRKRDAVAALPRMRKV